jgi:hypothetical protein
MPDDSSNSKGYTYTGSGTNSQVCCFPLQVFKVIDFVYRPQGNHYCSREGTDGGSGYHYSNTYVKSSDSDGLRLNCKYCTTQQRQLLLPEPQWFHLLQQRQRAVYLHFAQRLHQDQWQMSLLR